ncbi:MAG TPA: hypothetical protein VE861_00285 [Gemmatimonadaceae bacterium]|nr:hypothetical protein [Gemmatimonadaceae bacterium]
MSVKSEKSRNSYLRLGKAPARRDARNLQLRALLRKKLRLPAEYDFDLQHPNVPTPMFGNDEWGCCVISGRAHQTLRFELVEQQRIVRVTTKEVVDEYLSQSGGEDNGLITLDSLRLWRKQGWTAGRNRYAIRAFSEVNRTSTDEVKTAIVMNLGVGIGLRLPASAERELAAGKPWTITSGSGSTPNSWGGHYVYVTGYTKLGPTCVTWGRKQQMSWKFFARYCDEAYAIIDALNTPKKRAMLDETKLDAFLATVSKPTARGARKAKRPTKRS